MDRHTLALIGVVDTLQHVLESDETTARRKDFRAAAKRLETIRGELITEGLHYNKTIGAARDSVFEVAQQLQGYLAEQRGMQWVLSGLHAVNTRDVEPPPPPSSSSIGPKSPPPEVAQLAKAIVEIASAQSTSKRPRINDIIPLSRLKPKKSAHGRKIPKVGRK